MGLIIVIVLLTVALDQITKQLVTNFMELGDSISIIGDFFNLQYARNPGASFGIFSGNTVLLSTLAVVAILMIIVFLRRLTLENKRFLAIGLAFILGGAIGNLIDRLIFHEVIDFLHLSILPFIFNFADVALTIGGIMFGIEVLLLEPRRYKGKVPSLKDKMIVYCLPTIVLLIGIWVVYCTEGDFYSVTRILIITICLMITLESFIIKKINDTYFLPLKTLLFYNNFNFEQHGKEYLEFRFKLTSILSSCAMGFVLFSFALGLDIQFDLFVIIICSVVGLEMGYRKSKQMTLHSNKKFGAF